MEGGAPPKHYLANLMKGIFKSGFYKFHIHGSVHRSMTQ